MSGDYFLHGRWRSEAETALVLHGDRKRPDDIANAMGIPLSTVTMILRNDRETGADIAQSPPSIARSSLLLLAAIRRHHPERCGA